MRRFQKVTWSIAEEDYLRRNKNLPASQLTIALEKSTSAIKRKLIELEDGTPTKEVKTRQVSKIGRRSDCNNLFFRSTYEANLFRYLRYTDPKLIIEYEPTTFSFAPFGIMKGTVSYTPDFKISRRDENDVSEGYKLIEVKGFLRRQDKTKLKRFKKFYPEEFGRLIAVVSGKNSKTYTFFAQDLGMADEKIWIYGDLRKQFKNVIPGWET